MKLSRILRWSCIVACLLLALLQAWAYRFEISSDDAVSYLDLSDAWARGDFWNAVNGHWAPLYSWSLALAMAVLHPAPLWEYAVLNVVNVFWFLIALWGFDLVLREMLLARKEEEGSIPAWSLYAAAYALFAWASTLWVGTSFDTPDLAAAGFALLAAAQLLRIRRAGCSPIRAVAFGAVLALAYLAKSAMFPVALVFLFSLACLGGTGRDAVRRTGLAALAFVVMAGPYVAAVSHTCGHVTFSDSGRLSYANLVNPGPAKFPDIFWRGGPDGFGAPLHGPRVIWDDPPTFEFSGPIKGTYPPWLDPIYWNKGLQVRVDLRAEPRLILANVTFYGAHFLLVLLGLYVILVTLGDGVLPSLRAASALWPLALPALAGFGLYAVATNMELANVETQTCMRYIAPFILILAPLLFGTLRMRRAKRPVALLLAVCSLVFAIVGLARPVAGMLKKIPATGAHNRHEDVAAAMRALGLHAGDPVAMLGPIDFRHQAWGRLARIHFVAQVYNSPGYCEKDEATRHAVLRALASTGARLVVAGPEVRIPKQERSAWLRVGRAGFHARWLGACGESTMTSVVAPQAQLQGATTPEGGIILRRSSALRLLDDTVQYRPRRRALICGAI